VLLDTHQTRSTSILQLKNSDERKKRLYLLSMGCLKMDISDQYFTALKVVKETSRSGENTRAGSYRFGFNGKEKDDEISGIGILIHFEFREYDSRLGRFTSLDPLSSVYPSLSPFSFAANNPIKLIDVFGLGPDDPVTHEIKEGDTYYDLAKKSGGEFTVDDLISWNQGIDPKKLQIRQKINISDPSGTKSFEAVSSDIKENGFKTFLEYIDDDRYGIDYFYSEVRGIEFDRSGWLGEVIDNSEIVRDAFHIVAWRDAMISDGSEEVNRLEHQIGMFLISAMYGENSALSIGSMNELRGLIINDRRAGLMSKAVRNQGGNTAFEYSDQLHNIEGIYLYNVWLHKQGRITEAKLNQSHKVLQYMQNYVNSIDKIYNSK